MQLITNTFFFFQNVTFFYISATHKRIHTHKIHSQNSNIYATFKLLLNSSKVFCDLAVLGAILLGCNN